MQAHDVIKYPTMTERSVYMIENENKLIFIVQPRGNKEPDSRTPSRNSTRSRQRRSTHSSDRQGEKKAFIKLKEGFSASEVAIKLGIL